MMKHPVPRILSLIFAFSLYAQLPLYAVADIDTEDDPVKTAPAIQKPNSQSPLPTPQSLPQASSDLPADPSDTEPKDATSKSKEYSYSFTLPLPAGNVLPIIPDGDKLAPPKQDPINLPPVVPGIKKSLSWRNYALLMFSTTPDKSVIFKTYRRGNSDLITALVDQCTEQNYQITTDYISAGHVLIEIPEQISETKKSISFVLSFRLKDDDCSELGLKVLPPVSKYSLNLAQNFLAKVENRIQRSTQNTF